MKNFAKLAFLILLSSLSYAQPDDPYLDSLHVALVSVTSDTAQMEVYINLGTYLGRERDWD